MIYVNMYILINSKDGFGNRIYSLINIIYEAIKNKQQIELKNFNNNKYYNINYEPNKIFDIKQIENNFNKLYKLNNIIKKDLFFPKNLHRLNKRKIDVKQYFDICKKFIIPNLNKDIFVLLDKRICVMHVRSGDLFKNVVHPEYTQPPLAYYTKIINTYDNDYDKFIIITSPDMANPVINELKKIKKVKFLKNTIEEDYILMLRAETLVLSWSTFSDTIVFLSPNLKNLFFWNDGKHVFADTSIIPKHIKVNSISLIEKYIERGEWNGLDLNQHKIMLEYKKENILIN